MVKKLNMHHACQKLRLRDTDQCSADCQDAITELLSAYNGSEGIFTCNCNDTTMFYDQYDCELDRERLSLCPTLAALFPTDPPVVITTTVRPHTCIVASRDCEDEPGCKSRLNAYLEICNPERTNPETTPCSSECMGTLEALYAEPLSENFWDCSCAEETPAKWCRTSPHVYQQLCQSHFLPPSTPDDDDSPEVPYKPVTPKPSSSSSEKDQQTKEGSSAEENSDGPGSSASSLITANARSRTFLGVAVSLFGGALVLCLL